MDPAIQSQAARMCATNATLYAGGKYRKVRLCAHDRLRLYCAGDVKAARAEMEQLRQENAELKEQLRRMQGVFWE